MKKVILIDANIIIRFFLNDHPKLSPQAKSLFIKAGNGKLNLYLDEIVVAEVIWTLTSFYKINKHKIIEQFQTLLAQKWIVNPRKELIFKTLNLFGAQALDYIDCWLLVVSKSLNYNLTTFDNRLKKQFLSQ